MPPDEPSSQPVRVSGVLLTCHIVLASDEKPGKVSGMIDCTIKADGNSVHGNETAWAIKYENLSTSVITESSTVTSGFDKSYRFEAEDSAAAVELLKNAEISLDMKSAAGGNMTAVVFDSLDNPQILDPEPGKTCRDGGVLYNNACYYLGVVGDSCSRTCPADTSFMAEASALINNAESCGEILDIFNGESKDSIATPYATSGRPGCRIKGGEFVFTEGAVDSEGSAHNSRRVCSCE